MALAQSLKIGIGVLAATSVLAMIHFGLARRGEAPALLPSDRGAPVIVELFSSEGCRSCPPADAYIANLDRTQSIDGVTVIVLEEHVDYWDRLGWKDPFSSEELTLRQKVYSSVLPDHRVYTPEIIFDGHALMVGGDEDAARVMMTDAARDAKAHVAITRDGSSVTIDVTDLPGSVTANSDEDIAEVLLAITESGLETDVGSGENSGRTLAHGPVVRQLTSFGNMTEATFHKEMSIDTALSWKPRALRFVAFVQRTKSRKIVGASAI